MGLKKHILSLSVRRQGVGGMPLRAAEGGRGSARGKRLLGVTG